MLASLVETVAFVRAGMAMVPPRFTGTTLGGGGAVGFSAVDVLLARATELAKPS
jgi:hypothetical protein